MAKRGRKSKNRYTVQVVHNGQVTLFESAGSGSADNLANELRNIAKTITEVITYEAPTEGGDAHSG